MAHLTSSQTARIWAERIARCERSNAPVALPYPGRRFALPWAISFCPFGAGTSQPYRVGTVPGFSPRTGPNTLRLGDIHCHERLGGLLKRYSRKAA